MGQAYDLEVGYIFYMCKVLNFAISEILYIMTYCYWLGKMMSNNLDFFNVVCLSFKKLGNFGELVLYFNKIS